MILTVMGRVVLIIICMFAGNTAHATITPSEVRPISRGLQMALRLVEKQQVFQTNNRENQAQVIPSKLPNSGPNPSASTTSKQAKRK